MSAATAPRTPAEPTPPLDLDQVQALPLRTPQPAVVSHLLLGFADTAVALRWLADFPPAQQLHWGVAAAAGAEAALGFTFGGLERLALPLPVRALLRQRAPAFAAGAAARSASHLGDAGDSAARHWDEPFAAGWLDAVLTLHGTPSQLDAALAAQRDWFAAAPRGWVCERRGQALPAPADARAPDGRWVHFGYRDGLTQPAIDAAPLHPGATSRHAPGELLLGRERDLGDNPWSLTRLPQELRRFVLDGSFGVLRDIEQDVAAFEHEVERWAAAWQAHHATSLPDRDVQRFIRAKLCGRWPEGPVVRPGEGPGADIVARLNQPDPFAIDFYQHPDADGSGCPFASHVRRMNAEAGGGALPRPRVLFRRSLPYGGWPPAAGPRGLLGLFFCSSIEEQFEHLVGRWADRMPLGLVDGGRAQDPFIGAHDDADAPFVLRRGPGVAPLRLWGFRPFVRTRGTAYLFYPSRPGFEPLADPRRWVREAEPWLPA